jgi:sterol desaturase/sphingolipid hydroxylase (fatty acid hydroxylase superfamily)
MSAEEMVTLLIPATYFAMLGAERLAGGRAWPDVRLWRTKGVAFFVMLMSINAVLPSLLPEEVARYSLVSIAWLPLAAQAAVAFLAVTLANATLHRAYHRYDLLWRWVHQLHHAPQRIDVSSGVVFTPLEVVNNVLLFLAVNVLVLGTAPLAAAIVGYLAVLYGLFPHFNVRTPQWLGYLIQRPESHSVHHRRGFHAWNYSDLPLWDLVWGTFRNPAAFYGEVGFEAAPARRFGAMLLGRDANAALYGAKNRGRSDTAGNPA